MEFLNASAARPLQLIEPFCFAASETGQFSALAGRTGWFSFHLSRVHGPDSSASPFRQLAGA